LWDSEILLYSLNGVEVHFQLSPESGNPVASLNEGLCGKNGHTGRTGIHSACQCEKGGEENGSSTENVESQ
jgi:hypothetical protein